MAVSIPICGRQSAHATKTTIPLAGTVSIPIPVAVAVHPTQSLAVEEVLLKGRAHGEAIVAVQLDHVQAVAGQGLQRLSVLRMERNTNTNEY